MIIAAATTPPIAAGNVIERKERIGPAPSTKALSSAAAGTERQIADKLLERLENFDQFVPERDIVNKAVKEMDDVDLSNTIALLESAKAKSESGRLLPSQKALNADIDEYIRALSGKQKTLPEGYSVGKPMHLDTYGSGKNAEHKWTVRVNDADGNASRIRFQESATCRERASPG